MAEVILNQHGFANISIYVKQMQSPMMTPLQYKVDTGANRTTISLNWLRSLGYDDSFIQKGKLLEGDEHPSVATGEPVDNCYIVELPEINIGGYVGYNWPFLVSLNDKIQFRLLFGTDSMEFFIWLFDYEHRICKFDLIQGKRKLLFNKKEQSIHAIDDLLM